MLTFIAEDLSVTTAEELTAALESAIAGETIKLAEGNYDVAVNIGSGVIVDGEAKANLLQGATLADGAVLKRVTVTGAGVTGPETGRAELIQSIVKGVTGVAAVKQNMVLKTCLVYENTIGVMDSTAYLSTIVSNTAVGVSGTSRIYGTVVWGNEVDVEESVERIDSSVGGNPTSLKVSFDRSLLEGDHCAPFELGLLAHHVINAGNVLDEWVFGFQGANPSIKR